MVPSNMRNALWAIVAILLIIWLAGAVLDFIGGVIHVVLVVAIVLAVFAFLRKKV